jgi:hypothetical protein
MDYCKLYYALLNLKKVVILACFNVTIWPRFNPNQAFLLVQKLKLPPLPRAFTLGVKAKVEIFPFNLPKVTNKC